MQIYAEHEIRFARSDLTRVSRRWLSYWL